MQVTETLNEGLKRAYQIVLTAGELDEKVNEKLAEAQPDVEMKGFRKGKVPMALLKKQFGQPTINPVTLEFTNATAASTWTLDVSGYLPFGGNARTVSSVVVEGDLRNSSNQNVYHSPSAFPNAGTNDDQVQLKWPEACSGTVLVTARVDKPV